jgi:multidrug efflux pump subunit AcrA (membrane-fusion protein)
MTAAAEKELQLMTRSSSIGWWMICAAATCIVAFCVAQLSAQMGGPTRLLVVNSKTAMVREVVPLVGSVEPYRRSTIASEVSGVVERMPVDEGDWLEAGAVICELRSTTRKLGLQQAEAALRQLQSQLDELEAGTRKEEVEAAQARMEEAAALAEKWEKELARIRKLRDRASASEKELNDVLAESMAASQRYRQAKAEYELAIAGPREEVIAQARYAVAAQKAQIELLEYNLAQATIRAPYDGYVVTKHAEVGEWVNAGGPVVEYIDLEAVLVRVHVPESMISAAEVGEQIPIQIDAIQKTVRGKIENIIPQADEKARTFPVEVKLENKSHELKGGMFARARLPAGPEVESIIVPRDAIIQRGDSHYVVMVGPPPMPGAEGDYGVPVPVKLGTDVGDWVAVQSPMLQAGAPVAVKGQDRIYGPMPVMAMPADSSGGRAATQPAGNDGTPATKPGA